MDRQEHIEHLRARAEECAKAGDRKMAEMFTRKADNMLPVCDNCGQWQRPENYGDCFNRCIARGFAKAKP